MSTVPQPDNPQGQASGPSYQEFWADELERSQAMDAVLKENSMGGFDPKYAGLDVTSEDEGDGEEDDIADDDEEESDD